MIIINTNSLYLHQNRWYAKCYCHRCQTVTDFDMILPTEGGARVDSKEDFITHFQKRQAAGYQPWQSQCLTCHKDYNSAKLASPIDILAERFR
jgi:hypothetical protein